MAGYFCPQPKCSTNTTLLHVNPVNAAASRASSLAYVEQFSRSSLHSGYSDAQKKLSTDHQAFGLKNNFKFISKKGNLESNCKH